MKARSARRGARWLLLLFLAPVVFLLWPPFYNFTEPRLAGVPFFYWIQLAWIFVTVGLTVVVYLAVPREEDRGEATT